MSEEEICELYLNPNKGNNYISKDKIRDKIKEIENEIVLLDKDSKKIKTFAIKMLNEILEM